MFVMKKTKELGEKQSERVLAEKNVYNEVEQILRHGIARCFAFKGPHWCVRSSYGNFHSIDIVVVDESGNNFIRFQAGGSFTKICSAIGPGAIAGGQHLCSGVYGVHLVSIQKCTALSELHHLHCFMVGWDFCIVHKAPCTMKLNAQRRALYVSLVKPRPLKPKA